MKALFSVLLIFIVGCDSLVCDRVVGVSDGDTITVLTPNKERLKVRLAEIDCPESHQDYGTRAKQALSEKVFDKEIKLVWSKKDRYGRVIGKVYVGDRYINKEMIEEGWAWHYTEYSHDVELDKAQENAKKNKVGLWAGHNPVPPWEFRKNK